MKRIGSLALLALTLPAHAGTLHLYTRLGAGVDLDAPTYPALDCHPFCAWRRQPLFVSGPLADVALGLADGPVRVEVRHVSAIDDGFKGAGLTWASVGFTVDLWKRE